MEQCQCHSGSRGIPGLDNYPRRNRLVGELLLGDLLLVVAKILM